MMTAIDSSVLLAIFNAESDGPRWLEALIQARRKGRLIICEEHLIPDFLIAAHAKVHADRLAATDRGYLRRWFDDLRLLV